MNPIQIIGIGQGKKDLTRAHLELIYGCDLLVGGRRMLAMFEDAPARTLRITRRIDELVRSLEEQAVHSKIVVLASGDPLFYGIGAAFSRLLAKEKFTVHPNISSVGAAFATIRLPWHDAKVISFHGRNEDAFFWPQLAAQKKIAFLTDPVTTPAVIAKKLLRAHLTAFKPCVLENIGDPEKQKVTWFESIQDLANAQVSQPNILILIQPEPCRALNGHQTHLGMDDQLFRHEHGLITKSEVRAVSLSKLKLIRTDFVLWDIGSGSGSVGIEASFLLPDGQVYAIEKNENRIPDIITNVQRFNCSNVRIIHASYPEGVDPIPAPDRIFIGGGGSCLAGMITHAAEKLSDFGVIVINTVLVQNLESAVTTLNHLNIEPQVTQIQVSRGKAMPFGTRLEALNPVWIISGSKKRDPQ